MKVLSEQAVEVDGVPRLVRHLHHCSSPKSQVGTATDEGDEELVIQLPTQGNEREETDSEKDVNSEDAAEELDRVLPRRSSRLRKSRLCDICD